MFLNGKVTTFWRQITNNVQRKKAARLRIWHSFCEETPLQGFLIFRNSHTRYERALWLLLMALAIAVTLNDSSKTIHDFLKQEIRSVVSMERNDTISLPNVYICVQLDFVNSSAASSLTSKNDSEMIAFLAMHKKKILSYYEVVDEKNDFSFSVNETDVMFPVLLLSLQLVKSVNLVTLESYVPAGSKHTENVGNHTVNNSGISTVPDSPIMHLHTFFKQNGLDIAEVCKATGMRLCMWIHLEVGWNGNETVGSICQSRNIRGLNSSIRGNAGNSSLIIGVPYAFKFTNTMDKVYIQAMSIRRDIAITRLIVQFGLQIVDSMENGFQLSNAEHAYVDIEVTSMKMYGTRESPCSDAQQCRNHMRCHIVCRTDFIRRHCHCRMLGSSLLVDADVDFHGEICFDRLSFNESVAVLQQSCFKKFKKDPEMLNTCKAQCPRPCSHLHLRFSRSHLYDTDSVLTDNSTRVEFLISTHSYLHIEQVLAMDAQTLMSNLGGNMGLYIGGTFFAIIHLITSVTRLIASLIVAKDPENLSAAEQMELQKISTTGAALTVKVRMDVINDTMAKLLEEIQALKKLQDK